MFSGVVKSCLIWSTCVLHPVDTISVEREVQGAFSIGTKWNGGCAVSWKMTCWIVSFSLWPLYHKPFGKRCLWMFCACVCNHTDHQSHGLVKAECNLTPLSLLHFSSWFPLCLCVLSMDVWTHSMPMWKCPHSLGNSKAMISLFSFPPFVWRKQKRMKMVSGSLAPPFHHHWSSFTKFRHFMIKIHSANWAADHRKVSAKLLRYQ